MSLPLWILYGPCRISVRQGSQLCVHSHEQGSSQSVCRIVQEQDICVFLDHRSESARRRRCRASHRVSKVLLVVTIEIPCPCLGLGALKHCRILLELCPDRSHRHLGAVSLRSISQRMECDQQRENSDGLPVSMPLRQCAAARHCNPAPRTEVRGNVDTRGLQRLRVGSKIVEFV